jgi:cobaltochelatase CobN
MAMKSDSSIVLITHAETDLLVLAHAVKSIPADFPRVLGFNLQSIDRDDNVEEFLHTRLAGAKILVVRVLGRKTSVSILKELVAHCKRFDLSLIVVSGTGEPDPELTCLSTVDPSVIHETISYLQAGGVGNYVQLLKFLSDHLLLTTFGYDAPCPLPEQGIYHPDLFEGANLEDWLTKVQRGLPAVGITFYRAHWMSGNTAFVDAIVSALAERGLAALPVFTSSLKVASSDEDDLPSAFQLFIREGKPLIDVLINTTSFSMGDVDSGKGSARAVGMLSRLNVPVLQAIAANTTRRQWQESSRGLSPLDTAMNVVMPEFDGRIITVPISFKETTEAFDVVGYASLSDRVDRIAGIAFRLSCLRRKQNSAKRIALVFTNSNTKASQIGNAVGLDAPASVLQLMKAMAARGYDVGTIPENGNQIIHELIDRCSYDQTLISEDQYKRALGKVSSNQYRTWFEQLPEELRNRMIRQWGPAPGAAYVYKDYLTIAGIASGNLVFVLQPPRGYGMDPNAIYHQPDLPPTHHYCAMYRWLSEVWQADAIVHVGKHGTLEWLPGKGVGLSKDCFPDAFLGDLPLFYPFILNDPGEGAQAKRRAHATIVDHLTPPMTAAQTYGILAELAQLVDEYYQVEMLDPSKLPLLQQQIWDLIRKANLDRDLQLILSHDQDHDDDDHDDNDEHDHEWNEELTSHGVPVSLAEMDGVKVSHLIQEIDGYLCELGAAQIRDGLHTLGAVPEGDALVDMVCSLTRLPNLDVPGLQLEVAKTLDLGLEELLENKGRKLGHIGKKANDLTESPLVTCADALELIDRLCRKLIDLLHQYNFNHQAIERVIEQALGQLQDRTRLVAVLEYVCAKLVPNLRRTTEEIDNLLNGLEGCYVPSGASGSPTRGMSHILPTGRNFYSVDPRSLPSPSAWKVGQQLANETIRRFQSETGKCPESVSISVWGTSAMRTHGDDVAEILALLGVRPLWQAENRRLNGIQVVPLAELGRPRIDVTVRISGFFRDAFQHLIDLLDQALRAVMVLDESEKDNFVRKHYLADLASLLGEGMDLEAADGKAGYRIFGCKPGSYGAGILPLINERNWESHHDFAEAYVNWGGYAYGQNEAGVVAKEEFRKRLSTVEVALHNQDNREHDIFDSDDYLQFHGGMIATIRSLTGRRPRHYFGDSHDPDSARVRDLKQEALKVFRSRVVNPKWLESIQRHGYKGGLELTATVDYLFGYDATADIVDDWMYEEVAQAYALDRGMQEFFAENNPWALNAIAERLLEAVKRGMWSEPKRDTLSQLSQLYLDSEAKLEARSEKVQVAETAK